MDTILDLIIVDQNVFENHYLNIVENNKRPRMARKGVELALLSANPPVFSTQIVKNAFD